MGIDRTKPLSEITFRCKPCAYTFKAAPLRVVDATEQEHHPFEYFASCPLCQEECEQVYWERNAMKAWRNATGPKTEEGKAASAANLEGHPTKEESLRTRFNAMQHGLSARTATYFPAKPDGYSFCAQCDVDRGWCGAQAACSKKTELFMLHHAAFEQRNPKHLLGIHADFQASIFAVLQQILQTIIADGVKIVSPKWYTDKDGRTAVVEYVDEQGERRIINDVSAHPLFRPFGEILTRTGLSLSDMGMTAKIIEDEDAQLGKLSGENASQENMLEFQRNNTKSIEALRDLVVAARVRTSQDPVLIEHLAENGEQ